MKISEIGLKPGSVFEYPRNAHKVKLLPGHPVTERLAGLVCEIRSVSTVSEDYFLNFEIWHNGVPYDGTLWVPGDVPVEIYKEQESPTANTIL